MSSSHQISVLIVDDSEFELTLLTKILSELDINLLCASSGEEALEILAREKVALVLLDVMMEGISGIETATRMREEKTFAQIPVIFITATEMSNDQIQEGYGIGAVDYLSKPVNPVWLKSKVRVFCKLHEQRATIANQLDEIQNKNEVLKKQLEEIRELRGFIPICANCKKVRNDDGYWENLEHYVSEHSGAEFSHSVCPGCSKELYPEVKL